MPSGQRLLYSRLLSIAPLQITCVSRPLLVLLSSGLVMVFGLFFVALPGHGRSLLVVAGLLATTFFAASEPQAALEWARSAGWGLLLAAVACFSHLLLMRRRSRRQSVFPEPRTWRGRVDHRIVRDPILH